MKHYTLLGISLFLSTLFLTACSLKNPDVSETTEHQSSLAKQQESQGISKYVFDNNTKLATKIFNLEKKIVLLEKKINETPRGADRAKLVKSKSQLDEKIVLLRKQQIENAKAFQASNQQENNKSKIN
jgi:hypothetical protein